MRTAKVWINNKLVGIKDAKISVFDRSFLYGDCAFETMRSYSGAIFRLDEHIDRLLVSLKILKIPAPYSKKLLMRYCDRTLKAGGLKDAYVRLAVTRGEGRFGISYKDDFTPNVVIVAKPFEGYPRWMHDKGISAGIVDAVINERSPLSRIKSANFMPYILARFEAKSRGFDDAIMLNTKGHVAEGATSNVFIVKGKSIVTPSLESGALAGITRHEVIRIAGRMGLRARERKVVPSELKRADEVFFTNSLAEILPVVSVDRRKIGCGSPGPVTKLIHSAYRSLTCNFS